MKKKKRKKKKEKEVVSKSYIVIFGIRQKNLSLVYQIH